MGWVSSLIELRHIGIVFGLKYSSILTLVGLLNYILRYSNLIR